MTEPHGLIQKPLRGFIVSESGGIEAEIGGFGIKPAAGVEQSVEGLARIVGLQQRALAAAGGTLEENVRIGIQPGHDTDFLQGFPVFLTQDKPAAGGKNDSADSDEALHRPLLHFPEEFLAVTGKNLGNAPALALHDLIICVHEAVSGQRGQTAANGGFPAAHESDENEVG